MFHTFFPWLTEGSMLSCLVLKQDDHMHTNMSCDKLIMDHIGSKFTRLSTSLTRSVMLKVQESCDKDTL